MSRPTIVVVVVGTGTDVGKTWASCEILRDAARRGMTVAARKPAQSFAAGAPVTDASLLSEASGEDPIVVCPSHRWYPKAMAPPMAADALGRPEIALEELANEITWPAGIDFGLVEMAGGAASPIAHDGDCTDLAHRVAPDLVLLVAHAGLGTINSVRLSARGYAPLALVVLLNRFDPFDELHRANREWLVSNEGLSVIVDPADVLATAT